MKTIFLTYLFSFSLTATYISCREKSLNPSSSQSLKPDTTSNFVKDIPTFKKGNSKGLFTLLYEYTSREASLLHLDSLELGFDSLQVRIWLGHEMAIKKHAVIFKYTESNWSGCLVSYSRENEAGKRFLKEIIFTDVRPVSGWENFIQKMLALKILELPDDEDLPAYDGCAGDGLAYYFEWATKNKYRFYSYCGLDSNTDKFWQAKNVAEFADLVEKEFNFKYTK